MADAYDDDDFKPDYVELRLLGHAANKGFQAGSVLGAAIGVPWVAWRDRGRGDGVNPERLLSGAAYGAVGGAALSVLLYAGKRATIDREGVEDRVYRLHYNRSQRRVDSYTAAGATAGLAAAALMLRVRDPDSGARPPAMAMAGGAALGCAAAVVAHLVTRPANMRGPNRALDQLRH